jgi:hypothetical protein
VGAIVGQIGMYTSVARRTPSRMGTMTSIRHSTSKSGSKDGGALVVEVDASVGTDADLVRPKTMDLVIVRRTKSSLGSFL